MQPSRRRVIVNADDFGQSAGINEGIIRCHEQGILTSASLMVRWPHAAAAAAYARTRPAFSVGLHIDLGEWMFKDGAWTALYTVIPWEEPAAIHEEILRQVDTFYQLMGAAPTHLDSHQHVHCSAPSDRIVIDIAARLGVPVRQRSHVVRYDGSFYGQAGGGEALDGVITVEHLVTILRGLPAGTTELGCHPGLEGDAQGMYIAEREREVAVLCDPRVREAIDAEGIELMSFHELGTPHTLRHRAP